MAIDSPLITAEAFSSMLFVDEHTELLRGRMVSSPIPCIEHGYLSASVGAWLGNAVDRAGAGVVVMHCGIVVSRDPDSVLAPDIAAFLGENVPRPSNPDAWPEQAPDIVVEIVDVADLAETMQAKIAVYREAGVRVILVVWPASHSVTMYRSDDVSLIGEGPIIDLSGLIPGCRLDVRQAFS